MDMNRIYTKMRRDFGRQCLFSQTGPELCDSLFPDTVIQKQFMLRNPIHQQTQNTPPYSQQEVNTIRAIYTKTGINHAEGGWPKDVNVVDLEATQRYRRKIEKDEDYIHCVMNMTPEIEHYALQNNAIDMYELYYSTMPRMPPIEQSNCRVSNVYTEPGKFQRAVSSLCFSPDGTQLSSSYVDMDYYHQPNPRNPLTAYTWSIENATEPLATFEPPDSMIDFQFNPKDQNIFVGGLANGQVACFDGRTTARTAQAISAAYVSHRDIVRRVCFINSKTGTEFFSGSSDGSLKWWDLRNLEEFIEEQIIDPVNSPNDVQRMERAYGVCALEFEPTIPTRYMVGTENGFVIGGNRKGKNPMERLPSRFSAHNGTVKSLERNPQFLKNFLTVGDWALRVWSEDCRESCIILTPMQRHRITAATWSPTRGSLISSTVYNGQFAAWDLLQKQHEPIFTQQVCTEPLLKITAHESGSHVACGSGKGRVFLIEVSNFLSQSLKHDKFSMAAVFDRESRRERVIEARLREIRVKQRQVDEVTSPKASAITIDMTVGDRDLTEATNEYMAKVKHELAAM